MTDKPLCSTRPAASPDPLDTEAMVEYLIGERKLDADIAINNGWYPSRNAGDTELRVVIPCLSSDLANRYWQARRLVDSPDKYPLRYTSPHHVRRGDALAVVYPLSSKPKGTVLAEGPMDALAAAEAGFMGIGWMGTDPGDAPMVLAHRLRIKNRPTYVFSDKDAIPAAVRIWSNFIGSMLINAYPYKDLAAMPLEERLDYFSRTNSRELSR